MAIKKIKRPPGMHVADSLNFHLFEHENKRLNTLLDKIMVADANMHPGIFPAGFAYKGETFKRTYYSVKGLQNLHPSLHDQMDHYLADRDVIMADKVKIGSILRAILTPCDSAQDIRDALPECMVQFIADKHLPRTRPEAYTIQHQKLVMRQYQMILPRIQFYVSTRLLY